MQKIKSIAAMLGDKVVCGDPLPSLFCPLGNGDLEPHTHTHTHMRRVGHTHPNQGSVRECPFAQGK